VCEYYRLYCLNKLFYYIWARNFEKKIIIEFICTLISKCLARAHCLKFATKHHRHKLIRSSLKIQMFFFVLSNIYFSRADKKKIMGQKKKGT
jgi:hypothetical protein